MEPGLWRVTVSLTTAASGLRDSALLTSRASGAGPLLRVVLHYEIFPPFNAYNTLWEVRSDFRCCFGGTACFVGIARACVPSFS